jgi:hypothetical protein
MIFLVAVTKVLEEISKRRKDIFWLIIFKGTIHSCLAHALGQFTEVGTCGKGASLPHGGQESGRE